MRHYIVHALKFATFTLVAIVLVIAGAALLKNGTTSSLSGRLVSPRQNGETPVMNFTADRAEQGFSVPADMNVLFTIPDNVRIPRITFFGGRDFDQNNPYWGYCFSGNEAANQAAGKTGSAIYDGQFFYSLAERRNQEKKPQSGATGLLGILESQHAASPQARASVGEIFYSGQTCFVMSSVELPAGIDTDGDDLNNKQEQLRGTDAKIPDSDRDGIGDGNEVFVTRTNPLAVDSDQDGLGDRCEDENMNGNVDVRETSPLVADTDRDGLCDGNGSGSGCPEKKQVVCALDQDGERVCESRLTTPVYGEDMNGNCETDDGETDPANAQTFGINDWEYKWNLLGGVPKPGTPAPLFPIPTMPGQSSSSAGN